MATRHQPRWNLPLFVPFYLLVVGTGLLVGGAYVGATEPEEWFAAGLAIVGGLVMLATFAGLIAMRRR